MAAQFEQDFLVHRKGGPLGEEFRKIYGALIAGEGVAHAVDDCRNPHDGSGGGDAAGGLDVVECSRERCLHGAKTVGG